MQVEVEFTDMHKNTSGKGDYLGVYWHWGAKVWGANRIRYPGSPHSKRWMLYVGVVFDFGLLVNTISIPPGEYGRKTET